MPRDQSKKLSIFVAILILFAGISLCGYLILKAKTGSASISQQLNYVLGQNSVNSQDKNVDSDHDGLPDWQEKIYGTDPKNPDTDGDGYLDGEEVASGYDPLKKAPNDALVNAQTPRPLPQNLTKALSATLSQSVANGTIQSINHQTGKALTADELQQDPGIGQAIQDAVGQNVNEFSLPDISDDEIKISDKNDKDTMINYLKEVKNSLGKISSLDKPEMQAFIDAMESGDFSQLEKNQAVYKENYQRMKEISVPPSLVSFHKGLLGVFWVTDNIYSAVENISQDPLKATIAISQYRQIAIKTSDLLLAMLEKVKSYQ